MRKYGKHQRKLDTVEGHKGAAVYIEGTLQQQ